MSRPVAAAGLRVAITGGARGIGRAIAVALLDAGAKVYLGDLDRPAVQRTATELGVAGRRLDVADPADFAAFLTAAQTHLDGLDVLVNNAGIMPIGPLLDEDPELIARTVDVDLLGVITGTRLAGRRFAERGSGHVVNIASAMGVLTSPNAATYCAAKHAVVGFSAALRQEWRGTGVNVTAICPGFVRTELIAGMSAPRLLERFVVVDPEDVARAVVREIRRGSSRRVFVPTAAGLVARGTALVPTRIVDAVFRLSGGERVTAGVNHDERDDYRARVAGQR